MLHQWLGEMTLAHFASAHLGREPLARPAAAATAAERFDWEALDLLLRRPTLDVLVVCAGREREAPPPRTLAALRVLFARGLGVVVRRAERGHAELASLADAFARDLPGRVHVQVFATARGTHGFGWHYDAEEVFIVQTAGEKDYYFRRNTIDPEPRPGAQPDFARVREERTPIGTATLLPGDWLYLPRGWWHVAKARADSLSLSLGSLPPAA